jgi:TonB family protein
LLLKSVILLALAVCLGCGGILVRKENPLVVTAVEDAVDYDQPPTLVQSVKPAYPDFAREVRAEGRVLLKALVLEDGSVGAVQVLEATHPMLVDNAVEAVCHSVFSPAVRDGVPVAGTVVMPYVFSLDPNLIRTSVEEEPQSDVSNPGIDMNDRSRREEPEPRNGK